MLSQANVALAIEYLDQCSAERKAATLVGAFWYIDAKNKLVPDLEEINEALKQRRGLFVEQVNGQVVFSSTGTNREITIEEMRRADRQYRKEFAAAYAKLRSK